MASSPVEALRSQHKKYTDAVAEFKAVEAELQLQPNSARSADMLRINRETINAMLRSAELVRLRLEAIEMRPDSVSPFQRV